MNESQKELVAVLRRAEARLEELEARIEILERKPQYIPYPVCPSPPQQPIWPSYPPWGPTIWCGTHSTGEKPE